MTPKTAEALFDIFESTMKGGFGAAKIGLSFGLSNVFANIKMTPGSQGKLIKNLDKLAKYPHFAATALSCGFSIDEVRNAFNSTELSATEYKGAMQSVSALVGCIGDLLDGRPSGDAISYFVGLFDAGSSGVEDKFDAVMTLLDTLNIIIGYSPPTPFTNFVSGFIDVLSAGVDSYKAGQTIANEADAATDVAQAEIKKLQDKEIANVLKQYTIKNIIARLGSKLVREDLIIALPSVTDISPKSVVAGQSTVFTVTGANLPLTALLSMNNAAQSCDAPTNNTPTGFTTKCTAANTTSTSVTVVGSLDGPVLETQAVVVAAASSLNILRGATVTDSCTRCTIAYNGNPNSITDGNLLTARNIATYSGSFNIFLANSAAIDRLKLFPSMLPNGNVSFEIQTSTDAAGAPGTWTSHGGTKTAAWADRTWFNFQLNPNTANVRVIKVIVNNTPSWLAFHEIEAYAP